jgi:hypothetical protein
VCTPSRDKLDEVTRPVKSNGNASEANYAATEALIKEDGATTGRIEDTTSHGARKTRVDRVTAHGKLEVMIGPRYKAKKVWKPKTPDTVFLREDDLELLGSRSIARWGDNDMVGVTATNRRVALQEIEKEARVLKRTMQLDQWDSLLDQGKVKKVKTEKDSASTAASETVPNPFQRIQTGIQSMNRKRFQRQGIQGANVVHLPGKTKHSLNKHHKHG